HGRMSAGHMLGSTGTRSSCAALLSSSSGSRVKSPPAAPAVTTFVPASQPCSILLYAPKWANERMPIGSQGSCGYDWSSVQWSTVESGTSWPVDDVQT